MERSSKDLRRKLRDPKHAKCDPERAVTDQQCRAVYEEALLVNLDLSRFEIELERKVSDLEHVARIRNV